MSRFGENENVQKRTIQIISKLPRFCPNYSKIFLWSYANVIFIVLAETTCNNEVVFLEHWVTTPIIFD